MQRNQEPSQKRPEKENEEKQKLTRTRRKSSRTSKRKTPSMDRTQRNNPGIMPTRALRSICKERGSRGKEDTGIARKTRNTGKGENSTTEETTRNTIQRKRTRRAEARYQKEDHLAKGGNEGTNNINQRENEKRRNEEPGTSKESKNPMAKQKKREDRQESRRRAQRKSAETKGSTKPRRTKRKETTV